jgi:hypothetical protein
MVGKRHKTGKRGIYYVKNEDGTRTYVATWKEERPLNPSDPLATKRRTVEKEAATFDLACLLKAEGEASERKRQGKPPQRFVDQLGQRMMASNYFAWRSRR